MVEVECRVWGLPVSGVVGARVSVPGGVRGGRCLFFNGE